MKPPEILTFAMTFQYSALFDFLDVYHNIAFPLLERREFKGKYNIDDSIIDEIRKKNSQRVITVSELPKGMLWAPNIGGENSSQVVVHLSRQHPFYEKVYKKLESLLTSRL